MEACKAREYVGYKVRQAREHVRCEARKAREHLDHEAHRGRNLAHSSITITGLLFIRENFI